MNNGLTSVSPFLLNDVKDFDILGNELSKLKKLCLSLWHKNNDYAIECEIEK